MGVSKGPGHLHEAVVHAGVQSLSTFLRRKVGQYTLVLLVAVTLNFLLPRLMPGSPLGHLAGEDAGQLNAQERQKLIADAGLDAPLPAQYVRYVANLVQGDFGYSFQRKRPVTGLLLDRLPWTLLLTGTALGISAIIGVVFGALAGWRRGHRFDFAALALFIVLESLPAFWVAMLLVAVLAVQAGWLPTFGARTALVQLDGLAYWVDVARHLVLPLTTLVLVSVSGTFLTMRSSMLSVLGEEYITVARAKGLAERGVLFGHALRNAVLPVATVLLLNLGQLVAGATVVETVFSYPGLGRLLYEAVLARDYPLLQGGFLLITLSVLAANFVADLAYPLLDPRLTRGG
jgi:peptide/nickel transport system permease protein